MLRARWEGAVYVSALAELLNDNGYRWGDGRTYQGGCSIYRLISAI